MSEKGSTQLLDIIEKFDSDFCLSLSECHNLCMEKHLEGANNFPYFVILASDDTDVVKKNCNKSLLHFVKQTILEPWSDRQHEFVVLTSYEDEAFNTINCLFVLSAVALKKGDTTSLEKIQSIAVQYPHLPGSGYAMNNLGVMFSENALYKKSEKCFEIAKSYFEQTLCKQDDQRDACAVVTLNLAVLYRAMGNYQRAQDLCGEAASLCHDISMRKTKEAQLPAKLLRRVADMLEEFGNYKTFYKVLGIGVHFDISGGDEAAVIGLTKRLMKIQLKEKTGEKIQAEEVGDFISIVFALLDKPAVELLSAEVIRTVIITAKILCSIGHYEEACNLLEKLRNTFLMVHGGKSSLYGSLLYQIGCFLLGSGMFDEAEIVLKQAEDNLMCCFGSKHHAVALCKSSLGSCVLLKGNTKEALKHLNEGLAMFRKLNPNHPEVGEILLKLAFFYTKEGNFQCAHETVQEAMDILISACGELSAKTASGYFQSALVLLKIKALRSLAEEKLMKAIDIFLSLGLSPDHSDVMVCHSLLGVLQLSLRKYEEAEKCFVTIRRRLSLSGEPGIKARILAPSISLVSSLTAVHSLCAKIVSLVNLVHMKTCDERRNHLYTLVSCLEEHKTEELQIGDFAGQDVFFVSHRVPISDKPVVCILYSDPKLIPSQSSEGLNSDSLSDTVKSGDKGYMFLSSSVKNTHVLFLRIPHTVQEGFKSLASAFHTSMNTLFLQPKFRKGFVEGNDFYMELPVPADSCDVSSLCSQIDCLPLLVELKLSESQEQCDNFDYLTSWDSSMESVKPPVRVSYFSFKCANQREAEFVFDQVIRSFGQQLAVSKVVSNISLLQNVASFFFQEPRYSSLSVVVENKLVIVKCSSLKQSDLNCVTSSVRNALESTLESFCDVVRANFEQSAWLPCEDVGTGGCVKESSSGNCSLDVNSDPSSCGLTLGTANVIPCASSRDPESDLKRKPTVPDLLQDENADVNPTVSHPGDNFHADVDVCLCLLSYLLSQSRPVFTKEEASNSHAASTSGYDSGDSDIQVNQNLSESNKNQIRIKSESNQNLSESNSISSSLSYEEGSTVECCPDPETIETKHLDDWDQLQTSTSEVNEESSIFTVDNKGSAQDICTSDTKSSIASDSELLSTKWHQDLHVNQSQQQDVSVEFPQRITGSSSATSAEKIDAGTFTGDCLRPLLANLEDELAISQKKCYELQQQISQLEEQSRQSEEEKQNLQADLGKYLFLEGKEKRRERLLGGAAPVQDPGFTLHERLLEISNSLSAEEVKRIKFLAKSRVNGFRLARFTEAFELFEELETSGEFPCDYIGKLLAGIQRYDLVEKLGIPVALPGTERGSNHPPGQSMPHRKHKLSDHPSNSPKSMTAQDNSMDVLSDRHDNERHLSNGGNRNDHVSRTEETDYDCSQYASISSSGSSDETRHYTTENELTCSDMVVLRINAESDSSSSQSTSNGKECTRLPNTSDDDFLSDSSSTTISSSDSLVNSTQTAQAAASNCTSSQASSDSTDGSPMLTSVNSNSTFGSNEISSDSGLSPNSSEEENLRSSQMLAYGGEESEDRDVCDGAIRTAPSSACAVSTRTNSSDKSTCGFVRTHSGADVGNVPWSQQGAFPSAEMAAGGTHPSGAFNGTATDWEQQGARPKQGRVQHSVIKQMPGEPFIPVTDGLAGDFLARHTQDKALHDSLYQNVGAEMPLFNDTASQGASYIDGVIHISNSNNAKPYVGDCQAASGTDPYSRLGVSSGRFDGRSISYSEHLNNNNGPLPSHLRDNYFSVYGNYSQRNALNATNGLPLQSGSVHNNSRFSEHFGGVPHLPLETQQGPYPSVPNNQFFNSGVTGSGFADLSWNHTTIGTQSGHPVYGAQRYSLFNDNTSTLTSPQTTRQTPQNTKLVLGNHSNSITNNDNAPTASARNILHKDVQNSALPAAHAVSSCDPTRAAGLHSTTTSWPSLVCHSSNTTTVADEGLAQGSASGTSIPEPSCDNVDNHRASVLNNRDFGTDSVESTALEQRVAEACALVERVLREREEREQFGREIERKEQLIREQRAREKREREEREIQEAERWPQQQEAITARSQWLCEHYQRHCRVRFPCCTQFFPCHRCHNISKACDNEEAKACHASHLKCSHCQHEQEIDEDSEKCRKCGGKMSAYFCSICKHFTSIDKNPYHCEKCGICRIHKDKSFHCEVCNVCLDKRLQGNHKCRPDSGHDECCICLEDAFSGCQILPCSHKVHRECAIAMIQNGIRTCPICRHPLYSPPRE